MLAANGSSGLYRNAVEAMSGSGRILSSMQNSILLWALLAFVELAVFGTQAHGNPSGTRSVRQVDYLDDKAMFQPAWNALVASLPAGTRLYSITIEDKQITVQGTSKQGADRLDEWTIRRNRFLGLFERDDVSGPRPVQVARHTASFASALFSLEDVAINRLEEPIDAAVKRAALDDPAGVTRIEVARHL